MGSEVPLPLPRYMHRYYLVVALHIPVFHPVGGQAGVCSENGSPRSVTPEQDDTPIFGRNKQHECIVLLPPCTQQPRRMQRFWARVGSRPRHLDSNASAGFGMLSDRRERTPSQLEHGSFQTRQPCFPRVLANGVRDLAWFLAPSFVRSQGKASTATTSHPDRVDTAFLDGLRGYAAIAVMNYHILYAYQSMVFYGYGLSPARAAHCARPEDRQKFNFGFYQLPFLRLAYTGTWAISVFFVVSGFALSYRPLRTAGPSGAGFAGACAAVSSSFLRRVFRLYGPPAVATFATMLLVQLGAYEHGRQISSSHQWILVIDEAHAKRYDTLGLQLLDWIHETWRMLDVFWWGDRHNQYDVHLWTISTEFRCSLAIFLVLPAYMSVRPSVRKPLMAVVILYVYALDRWDVALFYAGLLIADTAVNRGAASDAPLPSAGPIRRTLLGSFRFGLLLLSLFLLSAPDFCMASTPGFQLLARLIPASDPAPFRFLPNLGGLLLVALLCHTEPSNPILFCTLRSALPQYLGRISYSLYIVHGPLIHTVGYLVFPVFLTVSGTNETWRYFAGFLMAYLLLVMAVVWVADVFWRAVDEPCVQLAKRIKGWMVF